MVRLVRMRVPEFQQFLSQEPQSRPHVWCVPENLKFSNFPRKNHKSQSHFWCLPKNLKFSNLSRNNPNPNHTFSAYPRTRNSAICLSQEPLPQTQELTSTPTTGLVAYPRTWSWAYCPARTLTPTQLPTTYLNPNHQFVFQNPQFQHQSRQLTSTPTTRLVLTRETEIQQIGKLSSKIY